ncbi:OmpL47-type beta-barrel domain-containing protein [Neobacillus drentensis]|uniref:OmpL47-type beta-barrel domain-containing protein n=1 Tax=Neobacillus drentensis TaxID=220684 RepID=UPI003000CCE8
MESKSGVAKTEYKVIDGSWQTYQGPFDVTAEGKNVVQYRSIDHVGNIEEAKSVSIKIDKTAPTLNVSFNSSVLIDRNHALIPIKAAVDGEDTLSGVNRVELISIESNQPENGKGDGNTVDDIQGADFETFDTDFLLRAERSGSGDRVYTVTYEAWDHAGNSVIQSNQIIVKHDNSKK